MIRGKKDFIMDSGVNRKGGIRTRNWRNTQMIQCPPEISICKVAETKIPRELYTTIRLARAFLVRLNLISSGTTHNVPEHIHAPSKNVLEQRDSVGLWQPQTMGFIL